MQWGLAELLQEGPRRHQCQLRTGYRYKRRPHPGPTESEPWGGYQDPQAIFFSTLILHRGAKERWRRGGESS